MKKLLISTLWIFSLSLMSITFLHAIPDDSLSDEDYTAAWKSDLVSKIPVDLNQEKSLNRSQTANLMSDLDKYVSFLADEAKNVNLNKYVHRTFNFIKHIKGIQTSLNRDDVKVYEAVNAQKLKVSLDNIQVSFLNDLRQALEAKAAKEAAEAKAAQEEFDRLVWESQQDAIKAAQEKAARETAEAKAAQEELQRLYDESQGKFTSAAENQRIVWLNDQGFNLRGYGKFTLQFKGPSLQSNVPSKASYRAVGQVKSDGSALFDIVLDDGSSSYRLGEIALRKSQIRYSHAVEFQHNGMSFQLQIIVTPVMDDSNALSVDRIKGYSVDIRKVIRSR